MIGWMDADFLEELFKYLQASLPVLQDREKDVPEFINLGWPIRCIFNDAFLDHEVELGVNCAAGNWRGRMMYGMLVSRRYGRTSGLLKLAHDFPSLGVTVSEKLILPRELFMQVGVDDTGILRWLMPFRGTMWLSTRRSLPFSFVWLGKKLTTHGAVNLDGDLIIRTGGVLSHRGWVLGGQLVYNVARNRLGGTNANGGLHGNSIAFGYTGPSYTFHAHCSRGLQQFGFGFYNRFSDAFQVAGKIGWDRRVQATTFGMAASSKQLYETRDFKLPYIVKAKIDNSGQMGLSATLQLGGNVKVTLCSNIGLLTRLRTTFGLGFYYGNREPGLRGNDCYNCCD